jgi:polyribonucleotide nucleotidyltransferase
MRNLKAQIVDNLGEEWVERQGEAYEVLGDLQKKISRDLILKEGRRIDGRRFDEIRPIACEVGILPRPHGSGLFTRGETQVIGVLTLGSGQDEQRVETLSGEEFRPFMLHYNFPPYSVGEVKRMGGPSRRDIGHGGLSTRAIEKILPDKACIRSPGVQWIVIHGNRLFVLSGPDGRRCSHQSARGRNRHGPG